MAKAFCNSKRYVYRIIPIYILVHFLTELQKRGEVGLPFSEAMLISPQQTLVLDVLRDSIFNNSFLTSLPSHLTFREEADTGDVLFKG